MKRKFCFSIFFVFLFADLLRAQDSTAFDWNVQSKKLSDGVYELVFKTDIKNGWQLYAPNQSISDVHTIELAFADSSIVADSVYKASGAPKKIVSKIFDNASFNVFEKEAAIAVTIRIKGTVPENLIGNFKYTYGKNDEFYPLIDYSFSVKLQGGISSVARIKISSFDPDSPVSNCGDDGAAGKGLANIFLLGLIGGFIALLTPCVFPLIPLTVSFFTKRASSRQKGIGHAMLYGLSIFLIYVLLSLPFHLLDHMSPEILNNISTNVWLNLLFFVVFIVFAISFFGYFEIALPGSISNKADAKAGVGNAAGIFFMALTLAIVSFSCTGPILGSLLAGALTKNEGAMQLSFGMGGFGLGLALPFALFAMFPNWLNSLPKSGGWLNSVKVVLGFLELAMAVKFLSNADLVEQWGLVKREWFIGFWIIIGILIVLYLLGKIRFPHDSPLQKFGKTRIGMIILFLLFTLYLAPGVTNTKYANLSLISGFPPPLCYSIYSNPVNCEKGVEPLKNDYEGALQQAGKMHKPLLIDFTGWACVNCRRMEENVWTDPTVRQLMQDSFIVVSLYVDERKVLPAAQQFTYTTKANAKKDIVTVGDKWATFQSENFNSVQQPQYAIISPDEKMLTKTKGYTPNAKQFAAWLQCGLEANRKTGR
ncbi:MAG: thioredoxin family protein [Bacteroidetes bacterium]|nr:thioredoxin family protein [Bacteroidota bacterium]MBS1973640.1 thioredoxin family protein [Bacteroidota bacterium]